MAVPTPPKTRQQRRRKLAPLSVAETTTQNDPNKAVGGPGGRAALERNLGSRTRQEHSQNMEASRQKIAGDSVTWRVWRQRTGGAKDAQGGRAPRTSMPHRRPRWHSSQAATRTVNDRRRH